MAQVHAYLSKATMSRGTSFKHLLLMLQLGLLPAVTQGMELVLGEAGLEKELPCKAPGKTNAAFAWINPDGIKILRTQNSILLLGSSKLKSRLEAKKNQWAQGEYSLIIKNLEVTDSGTYTCDVESQKTKVQLLVFGLTANPGVRLLQGQSLTLTLESPPGSKPSVQYEGPGDKSKRKLDEAQNRLSVSQLGFPESGPWTCIVSLDGKRLKLVRNILVLAFQDIPRTVYKREKEKVLFSFPLTFSDENLSGELSWLAEKALSPQVWITFSLKDRKVVEKTVPQDLKLQMEETYPLRFSLPHALPHLAGSGNLTLNLAKGKLHREVNLVVMSVTQPQGSLVCKVQGPTSPRLTLSLQLENNTRKVSKQEKLVQVQDPEAGVWRCLLSDKSQVLLESRFTVDTTTGSSPKTLSLTLAAGLGGSLFLIFTSLCIFCCVRCRHQRRQAKQISHIKRLLSEKKTCQCPRSRR
ncbi:T-cell surface glycoprotein CD4 [Dasypus novemcinctus]|uniref:T-cell surface glycoprotein CD4 n=1 Tax=Dasypus novemcinctus TaxID=9361 RepID=UPI00062A6201|nr:T-cell surface glycoprotein CD4 [Dasypus novemcinctus]